MKTIQGKVCICCGSEFGRKRHPSGQWEAFTELNKRKFCSHSCYSTFNSRANHWHWKGGIKKRADGYLRYTDDTYVHRAIMETFLGRKLDRTEVVHHKDGNTSNNSLENLTVYSNAWHRVEHCKTQPRNEKGRFCNV